MLNANFAVIVCLLYKMRARVALADVAIEIYDANNNDSSFLFERIYFFFFDLFVVCLLIFRFACTIYVWRCQITKKNTKSYIMRDVAVHLI